jgi:protein-L-isoaspartate(D-aspartate) O-methyltransferase
MEATPGIEPGYADLQSDASPLRHVALAVSYHNRFRLKTRLRWRGSYDSSGHATARILLAWLFLIVAGRRPMQFQAARLLMVESQIRPNGVRNPLVLKAFAAVPREIFVPGNQKPLAYMDEALPVIAASGGSGRRSLLPPMILGRMLEAAGPGPSDRALDIGGATGYSAAILSQLCGSVTALEEDEAIASEMRQCLELAKAGNVTVITGPLYEGAEGRKLFDLILLNGAVEAEPEKLFDQLAGDGRLVTIHQQGRLGRGMLYIKSLGAISGRVLFDASADILPGFESKPNFVF